MFRHAFPAAPSAVADAPKAAALLFEAQAQAPAQDLAQALALALALAAVDGARS
ncbi:hypothetical protein AB0F11_15105 [Streptomyces sp. NPDC032472]|uniref:hypothetical protein n=1 Tax=Streptomyces sp. NPDC032472 TaxID=3155018 RepID=UPI0033E66817